MLSTRVAASCWCAGSSSWPPLTPLLIVVHLLPSHAATQLALVNPPAVVKKKKRCQFLEEKVSVPSLFNIPTSAFFAALDAQLSTDAPALPHRPQPASRVEN